MKHLVIQFSIVQKERVEASGFQMGLSALNKHLTNCSPTSFTYVDHVNKENVPRRHSGTNILPVKKRYTGGTFSIGKIQT